MKRACFAAVVSALALGGCAAERAGREFRQRLPSLVGQPVQLLVDEIGPGTSRAQGGGSRGWTSISIGRVTRVCQIAVSTDQDDRILSASMTGGDYYCGSEILELRKRGAHYRRNPGLREREAAEAEALAQEILRLRRLINEGREDLPLAPVEQPD